LLGGLPSLFQWWRFVSPRCGRRWCSQRK
jgi:hypothetical protein